MPGFKAGSSRSSSPSLYQLLDPEILADPYPLYRRLRERDPVHWDPFLHAWVVTGYAEVLAVLHAFSADRTPAPQQLNDMGLQSLEPIARLMTRQMLFLDPPAHTRLRGLCSAAFTPRRVEALRQHVQRIADRLIDDVAHRGSMDIVADFANKLPAIVTAAMLGVPVGDHEQLKAWSADFAEMLGNFQHNPERIDRVLRSVADMNAYFAKALRSEVRAPGLLTALATAEVDGTRLTEEEIIANAIVTMVGGQETTTNLIGNGLLTLLRNPAQLNQLRDEPDLIESAVEELLRYESPSQHTARLAPADLALGGKQLRKGQAVMAVMAAAIATRPVSPIPTGWI